MTLQVFKQSATFGPLEPKGPVPKPLSDQICHTSAVNFQLEGARSGIWEATPGSYARHIAEGEVMHILSGSCSFTPEQGEKLEIRAGDTLYFPPNTHGVWDIREPLRKVFVVIVP